jgi:hypothetical protein
MAPFIVLIALFGFFYVLGSVWLPARFDWLASLRLALAGMFLLTASAPLFNFRIADKRELGPHRSTWASLS